MPYLNLNHNKITMIPAKRAGMYVCCENTEVAIRSVSLYDFMQTEKVLCIKTCI